MASASVRPESPLIVIVGPTASGKTALAIEIAKRCNGEIICADSRTVYKDMDVGTAKPTKSEQQQVMHWGIDLVLPNETFNAAQFKVYTVKKIADIRARAKTPVLVGGSGLYVNAVIFDYMFTAGKADALTREKLETKTISYLQNYCQKNNIKLPINNKNKRHLISVIVQNGNNLNSNSDIIPNTIVVGIAIERDDLRQRITQRAEQLLYNNVVKESITLGKKYGWDSEAMTGNVYPIVRQFLEHKISEERMKQLFITKDMQLAKRQMTWFKRNKHIYWGDPTAILEYISVQLARQ